MIQNGTNARSSLKGEKEVNTGQAVEGYTIQLYSEGKIEKTYVIAYADINDAKAPEALKGKAGYVFKEWNTKEDGSGEAYKPGDSISKLLKSENPAMQNLDSANTNSVVQDKKMGEMESEESESNGRKCWKYSTDIIR